MNSIPHWPAVMDLPTASFYCGMTPGAFKKICLVMPLKFEHPTKGARFLRQELDAWLYPVTEPDRLPLAAEMEASHAE